MTQWAWVSKKCNFIARMRYFLSHCSIVQSDSYFYFFLLWVQFFFQEDDCMYVLDSSLIITLKIISLVFDERKNSAQWPTLKLMDFDAMRSKIKILSSGEVWMHGICILFDNFIAMSVLDVVTECGIWRCTT